jgi:hypothetical protein
MPSGKQAFGIPQKMDTDKQLQHLRREYEESGVSLRGSTDDNFRQERGARPPVATAAYESDALLASTLKSFGLVSTIKTP